MTFLVPQTFSRYVRLCSGNDFLCFSWNPFWQHPEIFPGLCSLAVAFTCRQKNQLHLHVFPVKKRFETHALYLNPPGGCLACANLSLSISCKRFLLIWSFNVGAKEPLQTEDLDCWYKKNQIKVLQPVAWPENKFINSSVKSTLCGWLWKVSFT